MVLISNENKIISKREWDAEKECQVISSACFPNPSWLTSSWIEGMTQALTLFRELFYVKLKLFWEM